MESLDGSRLITHDRGYAPRLWDARTMRLLRVLATGKGIVRFVTFSNDGKSVLTVSEQGAQIWDAQRAKVNYSFDAPEGVKFVTGALSDDGTKFACGDKDGKVFFVSSSGAFPTVSAKPGHSLLVRHIVFSPDGASAVSTSMDKTAILWKVVDGQPVHKLDHPETVHWAQISPDSKTILTTCEDDTGRAWDAESGKLLYSKPHVIGYKGMSPQTLMAALFVGPDGGEALFADNDGAMHVVEARTGKEVRKLTGHKLPIREIRKTRDGSRVATYGDDDQLLVTNTQTGKLYPITRVDIGGSFGETAGEFSPDGSAFLLGYTDGSIRRHMLESGAVTSETLGALSPLTIGKMLGDSHTVYMKHGGTYTFLNLDAMGSAPSLSYNVWKEWTSPDGSRVIFKFAPNYNVHAGLFDTATAKYYMGYMNMEGAAFSQQSDLFLTWHDDAAIHIRKAADGEHLKGWTWKDSDIQGAAFSPDGKLIVSSGHINGSIVVWNWETGQTISEFGEQMGEDCAVAFTPDGKHVLAVGDSKTQAFEVTTGKVVFELTREDTGWELPQISFSPDGKRALIAHMMRFHVIDTENWKELWTRRSDGPNWMSIDSVSKDWKTMVVSRYTKVQIVKLDSGEEIASGEIDADIYDTSLAMGDSRLFTVDNMNGIAVWDAKPGTDGKLKKLGSLVMMKDGKWLAMDTEGRFDAPDPAKVDGASFVLEWEGGLEAIAIPQLKDLFYEPGLFAKLMGIYKEPMRPVPDLSSLRLYPDVKLAKNEKTPTAVDISLKQRDQGGLGTVNIWVNGKQVVTRRGAGYFQFDTAAFSQYLLPETHLPKGRGNVVQVQVTNDRKDLASSLHTLDIGIPPGLKAPEVRLFALCVGVSDYAGSGGDLIAPKSDARALALAIKESAERLLPGRVNIKTLTTDGLSENDKPTRENILGWFQDTAKNAASTDIVFAFFAGHGVSRIGERRGYFFLTPEADPTSVSEAVASTGAIGAEDLRELLGKIAANKQVVILDTCHSGAASDSLLAADRSVSGDYQRAWESIKDATGTWLLAGSAADQLSYESANVEHGMLTYSLLEAIDRASADGLRQAPSGELFVDVERWLTYAASRVESLKNEVGLKGVQRPEFKRSASGTTFDIGVTTTERRGSVGLKPPKPVVIIGEFEMDKEDPAGIEDAVKAAMRESTVVKPWFDLAKHPNVFRIAGSYTQEGSRVLLKVYLQRFDAKQARKTVETFEVAGTAAELSALVRSAVEERITKLAADQKPTTPPVTGG